ncbi:MAG: 3'-phosphoesterase [Candidatus Levybacteria bacterium]|nr:3'-phosphoesterase [Candidatus Levybacteria bacterium]
MTSEKHLFFVVHKHRATRLHYDFRLEIGGIMPSWAIPKGPTLDPKMKRLAMKVSDHTFSYREFEGILPEGSYGAGAVMIWDEGYYLPEVEEAKGIRRVIKERKEGEKVMEEGLKKGEIKFQLFGKKLHGSFALVKTRGFAGKNAWLLIKHNDEFIKEGYDANNYDTSAKSGKAMIEIR